MRSACLALLLFTAPAFADPPKLAIPPVIPAAGDYVLFVPDTDAVSVAYVGQSGVEPVPSAALADKRMFLLPVRGLPQGSYKFTGVGASKTGEQAQQAFAVVVGAAPPTPTPPGPNPPEPQPPEPQPPQPIPAEGLRVLMVYETETLSKLPPAQTAIFTAGAVNEYLNAKCAKGPDGKTAEYRIWDQNVNVANETAVWQAMFKVPRQSVPWLIVSGQGRVLFSGPLPADVAGMMATLKKFGG